MASGTALEIGQQMTTMLQGAQGLGMEKARRQDQQSSRMEDVREQMTGMLQGILTILPDEDRRVQAAPSRRIEEMMADGANLVRHRAGGRASTWKIEVDVLISMPIHLAATAPLRGTGPIRGKAVVWIAAGSASSRTRVIAQPHSKIARIQEHNRAATVAAGSVSLPGANARMTAQRHAGTRTAAVLNWS